MSIISPQDDNFAMEGGRQPITFENPLYANASTASGDPAVIHATQVPAHVFMQQSATLGTTLREQTHSLIM